MFSQWQRYWRRNEPAEAHKAIKLADWESILLMANTYHLDTVLEFGSGLSTILFSRTFQSTVSVETDAALIKRLEPQCPGAIFVHWDNQQETLPVEGLFDFALVDGILPRAPQARIALKHARMIAVHDPGNSGRDAQPLLDHLPVIEQSSRHMKVYHNARGAVG